MKTKTNLDKLALIRYIYITHRFKIRNHWSFTLPILEHNLRYLRPSANQSKSIQMQQYVFRIRISFRSTGTQWKNTKIQNFRRNDSNDTSALHTSLLLRHLARLLIAYIRSMFLWKLREFRFEHEDRARRRLLSEDICIRKDRASENFKPWNFPDLMRKSRANVYMFPHVPRFILF